MPDNPTQQDAGLRQAKATARDMQRAAEGFTYRQGIRDCLAELNGQIRRLVPEDVMKWDGFGPLVCEVAPLKSKLEVMLDE